MIRRAFALLASAALGAAGHAALPVGAKAPDIRTQASLGGKVMPFVLSEALKKGPVVLYFYPAAFTPGCTVEAHQFAEATDDFRKAGATVVGMSGDTIEKLQKFSVSECRSKFAVGVADKATIKAYNVALPVMAGRSNRTSYVIGRDGRIAYAYSAMDASQHVANTLAAVRKLPAKG